MRLTAVAPSGRAQLQLEPIAKQESSDGTCKLTFAAGASAIETVIIPAGTRHTVCISSQAGCPLACRFCLTGRQGFAGNLAAGQMVGQFDYAAQTIRPPGRATNAVFMGMGEPLLNLDELVPALRLLTEAKGRGLPRRRVMVSTAGIIAGIDRLRTQAPVALAVSLHAPEDGLRRELMPIAKSNPLDGLLDACRRYADAAPRRFVTLEYALLAGVNDAPSQARDLARLLVRLPSKINLIPFNPYPGACFAAPSPEAVQRFRAELARAGAVAVVRRPRGRDILAACGQLAGEVRSKGKGARRNSLPAGREARWMQPN